MSNQCSNHNTGSTSCRARTKKENITADCTYRSAWRFQLRFALQLVSAVVVQVALCRWFLWRVSWRKVHLLFPGKENPTYKTHQCHAGWDCVTTHQHQVYMIFTSKFPNLQTIFPDQTTHTICLRCQLTLHLHIFGWCTQDTPRRQQFHVTPAMSKL